MDLSSRFLGVLPEDKEWDTPEFSMDAKVPECVAFVENFPICSAVK